MSKGDLLTSDLAKIVGQRIRSYRTKLGYSQEKLAEFAGCHPTYLGQLERGEKNATLESIAKISSALNVSLSELLAEIGGSADEQRKIPLECYNLVLGKSEEEQKIILQILVSLENYKHI